MKHKKLVLSSLIALLISIVLGCQPQQQPQPPKPQQQLQQPQPSKPVTIQPEAKQPQAKSFNQKFEIVFNVYVDKNGLVDYAKLNRMQIKWKPLPKELAELSPADYNSWPREEKIAFWINTYNLFTIKLIVDNYPITPLWYKVVLYPPNSIMQIPDAWDKHYFMVMGKEYNLSEIEKQILLPQFSNLKVCFAISNATIGGPQLLNEPYIGSKLGRQLEIQVKKYLFSPYGFGIDEKQQKAYLPVIFDWYKDLFVKEYGTDEIFRSYKTEERAFLNFLSRYISKRDLDYINGKNCPVGYRRFDWSLNEKTK